jgi:cytoskeletal protein RodZ
MTTTNDEDGLTREAPSLTLRDDSGIPGDTVVPRHRHRREAPPPTPSPVGRVVLPLALTVLSVVALFAAWVHLQGEGSTPPSTSAGPAAAASPSASKPVVPVLSESPSPQETESVEAETPSPTTTPQPTRTSIPIDRTVAVTVLNGTRTTGLASRVAADLRAKGWNVVSVGNWRGTGIGQTTVFVNGEKDAVATIKRDLPAIDRARAPIGAMNDGRMTVVIMGDYPR